jgi:hypothetical protein
MQFCNDTCEGQTVKLLNNYTFIGEVYRFTMEML